jgi:hypothetical protein
MEKVANFLFLKLKNKPLLPDYYKINIFNTCAYKCLTYFWDPLQIRVLIYLYITYSSLYLLDGGYLPSSSLFFLFLFWL